MFQKYKLKPVITEAVQWDGSLGLARILVKMPGNTFVHYENTNRLEMATAFGGQLVNINDWIVRGVNGYFTCTP